MRETAEQERAVDLATAFDQQAGDVLGTEFLEQPMEVDA